MDNLLYKTPINKDQLKKMRNYAKVSSKFPKPKHKQDKQLFNEAV
jgi:hypothetical protein